MELKFWGTRGSCAAPFANRSEFGGNTSCLSIRSGNCWLVLDAGTGIIPLAAEISRAASEPNAEPCVIHILLSHFHLDHIIGLPMFLAALPKAAKVTMYAAPGTETDLPYAGKLVTLIGPPLWPVKLTDVCPQLAFADLSHTAENVIGNGIVVKSMQSNHPNNASIFRILWNGVDLVYGLDCEITDVFEEQYIHFSKGCDYLLYDGAYTDEDYVRCAGFGHSAISRAITIARETGVKHLYILHYDYAYTDAALRAAEGALNSENGCIHFAREGMTVSLTLKSE